MLNRENLSLVIIIKSFEIIKFAFKVNYTYDNEKES